jgi:hypothetical protein
MDPKKQKKEIDKANKKLMGWNKTVEQKKLQEIIRKPTRKKKMKKKKRKMNEI